jgi:hypothetical protein
VIEAANARRRISARRTFETDGWVDDTDVWVDLAPHVQLPCPRRALKAPESLKELYRRA